MRNFQPVTGGEVRYSMSKRNTMTQLGRVLAGVCTNPKHVWTTVQGMGTRNVFEVCMRDKKIKLREGQTDRNTIK